MERNDSFGASPELVVELQKHITKEQLDILVRFIEQPPADDEVAIGALILKHRKGKGATYVSRRFANIFVNLRALFTTALPTAIAIEDSCHWWSQALLGLVAIRLLVDGGEVELSLNHGKVIKWLWIEHPQDFGIPIKAVKEEFSYMGDELQTILEDLNDLKAIELGDEDLWKIEYLIVKKSGQ